MSTAASNRPVRSASLALACAAVALLALLALPRSAKADTYAPCAGQVVASWQGASVGQDITIPSLTQPNGNTSYAGSIFRPEDLTAYPGPRPLVVLQHGLGGNRCGLYWAARLLAGHGYITMTWTSPQQGDNGKAFLNGLDATRSAIAFAKTSANPLLAITDNSRIGISGHSMGSIITSVLQAYPDPGIKAAIASDNLRRWITGDPGAAANECLGARSAEVTPTVPTLGFAKDEPCNGLPTVTDPDLKQAGFQWWRSHGVPSMELVMAGFNHGDFVQGGSDLQHRYLAHYYLAWFGRWILGDESQTPALLAETVEGAPTTSILSSHYLSGAYLPPGLDTSDYVAWLRSDRVDPVTRKSGTKPSGRYTLRGIERHGLTFRFASSEAGRFQCKLDGDEWKSCKSPRRFKRLSVRKHAFRARAIDTAGNVDSTPVLWRFRVVR